MARGRTSLCNLQYIMQKTCDTSWQLAVLNWESQLHCERSISRIPGPTPIMRSKDYNGVQAAPLHRMHVPNPFISVCIHHVYRNRSNHHAVVSPAAAPVGLGEKPQLLGT